ncbi:glycerophosphodiester phosphodiesterase family protein [Pelagibacterium halotolerans]|uniref:glycerophosphodiester phosphodiesterase family protein n=1 Tax=Pelagibacterium halotolerans TaxID=531813 RepID=UPI00384AD0A6
MHQTSPLSVSATLSRGLPLIVAHRGEWAESPENSLAAFADARAAGAHIVEFDTQTVADGTLVVIHDETVDRTTDGSGAVADLALAEIRALRLRAGGGGDEAPLTPLWVPTLAEALEAVRGRVLVNIDTKYMRDLDTVAATVLAMDMADQVVLKGPVDLDGDNARFLNAPWFGQIPFMPILPAREGRFAEDAARIIADFRPSMLEIGFSRLEDVLEARPVLDHHNVRLWTNTLDPVHSLDFNDTRAKSDPDAVWGRLIDAGITVLQTDLSPQLARYLTERYESFF